VVSLQGIDYDIFSLNSRDLLGGAEMANTQSFQCPNCGSPVSTTGAEKEVKCDYCGTTVIVPEELRDHSTPIDVSYGQTIQMEDEVLKTVGSVAKVTAGVTVGVTAMSVILPIALTCIILGAVGFIIFTVFSGIKSSSLLSAVPTDIPVILTDIPTDTPTLAPTPIDTPIPFSKILLKDDFTNPSSGWDKAHNSNYTLEYKNGTYHILINNPQNGQIVWRTNKYKDESIEVGIQQNGGANDGHFGVACRVTDTGSLYSFEFSQDGTYGIYKYTNWSSDPLDEGTLDPNTIDQGKINHLEGICNGDILTLLINGQLLLQIQDSEYSSGGIGLIALPGTSGGTGVDVQFSHLLVKGP
jgi:DNA-directed RNA polymerase subunit RPC12/RpoP